MSEHRERLETDDETGLTLDLIPDGDCECPVSADDDAVIFAVLHGRYINPAKDRTEGDFTTVEGIDDFFNANNRHEPEWIVVPLYMIDHSGTAYRASFEGNPFSCPWDSGRVGIIAMKREEFGDPEGDDYGRAQTIWLDRANAICRDYTAWANGDCYGYVIEDAEGEQVEDGSCWGFVGHDYAEEQAREAFAGALEAARAKLAEGLEAERPDLYAGA